MAFGDSQHRGVIETPRSAENSTIQNNGVVTGFDDINSRWSILMNTTEAEKLLDHYPSDFTPNRHVPHTNAVINGTLLQS